MRQASRIATTSACAVGSFVAVTRFVPSAIMRPSFTITAANGPPLPLRTLSIARAIARRMNSCFIGDSSRFQGASTPAKYQYECAVSRRLQNGANLRRWVRYNLSKSRKCAMRQVNSPAFALELQTDGNGKPPDWKVDSAQGRPRKGHRCCALRRRFDLPGHDLRRHRAKLGGAREDPWYP